MTDPRIQRLAGEAAYAAAEHDPDNAVKVVVDRAAHAVQLIITASQDDEYQRHTWTATATMVLPLLDELLRELLAARASLIKLQGKDDA